MIDARELRLGNLINFPFIGANVEVLGLALKDDYKLFIQSNLNDNTFFETPEKYQPIPLTEQWLLDFGFECNYKDIKTETFYSIKLNDNFKLYYSLLKNKITLDKKYVGNVYAKQIDYVHQLQNLYYALTGQELELNKK